MSKIKVLLVDDSSFMRIVLSDIVNSGNDFEVVDTAIDGKEAVTKTKQLKPDVVLLDLTMKDYDGLYAVKNIMRECPTPIIILSGMGNTNPNAYVEALEAGAYDFLNKPSGIINSKIRTIDKQIWAKIKDASGIDSKKLGLSTHQRNSHPHTFDATLNYKVIIIGSSTGGTGAIEQIILNLPGNLPIPVLIAQHMPNEFIYSFAARLNELTPLTVKVANEGETLKPSVIYILPGHTNTKTIKTDNLVRFKYTSEYFTEFNNPSVNCIMNSIAEVYNKEAMAIILTGMGKDGTEGMGNLHGAGAYTIAQDEKSSVVWGMPKSAFEAGFVKTILPIKEMANFIVSALS